MAKVHGKNGRFLVAALELGVTEWEFDYANDLQEVTDSLSLGHKQYIPGLDGGTWSAKAFWDPSANPTTTPPNLNPGATLTAANLYVTATSFWSFPAIVESMKVSVNVQNVVNWNVSGKTNGAVTLPL